MAVWCVCRQTTSADLRKREKLRGESCTIKASVVLSGRTALDLMLRAVLCRYDDGLSQPVTVGSETKVSFPERTDIAASSYFSFRRYNLAP